MSLAELAHPMTDRSCEDVCLGFSGVKKEDIVRSRASLLHCQKVLPGMAAGV